MKKQLQITGRTVFIPFLAILICLMAGSAIKTNAQCSTQQTPNGNRSICEGGSVSMSARIMGDPSDYIWEWEKDGIIISTIENVYNATTSGEYRLILTEKSTSCRAVSPNLTIVTVNPLPVAVIDLTGPVEICPGGEVTIDAGSHTGFQYEWFKDGSMVGVNPTYTVEEGGSYRVRVTDTNSCVDTSDVLLVNDGTPPVVSLSLQDTSVCAGEAVLLEALVSEPDLLFLWQHGQDTVTDSDSAFIEINRTGLWSVIVSRSGAIGCDAISDTAVITVNPLPAPQIVRDEAELHVPEGYVSYRWMLNGSDINGADTRSWTAVEDGDYSVSVTDSNGCTGVSPVESVTLPASSVAAFEHNEPFVKIYPNPARNVLTVDAVTSFHMEISGLTGKVLLQHSGSAGKHLLSLDALPAGLYLYRITDDRKITVHTGKLIRQ